MLAFENGVLVHRGVDFTVGADIHTLSENQVSVTDYHSKAHAEGMRICEWVRRRVALWALS